MFSSARLQNGSEPICELSCKARAFSVDALIGVKHCREFENEGTSQKEKAAERRTVRVDLCSRDLWAKFHDIGTEMIITKAGRRMFPTMKVRLSGLEPTENYIVFLDVVPVDDKRYRYVYHSSEWIVAGSAEPPMPPAIYIHPASPAPGQLWMDQGVLAFDKLKLTNNRKPQVKGQVTLHSMHRYVPRVNVMLTSDVVTSVEQQVSVEQSLTFTFAETVFTTVTAYQNQKITRLKIASNPFAKGFREAYKSRDGDIFSACNRLRAIGEPTYDATGYFNFNTRPFPPIRILPTSPPTQNTACKCHILKLHEDRSEDHQHHWFSNTTISTLVQGYSGTNRNQKANKKGSSPLDLTSIK